MSSGREDLSPPLRHTEGTRTHLRVSGHCRGLSEARVSVAEVGPHWQVPQRGTGSLQEAARLQGRRLAAAPRGIRYLRERRMLNVR